MHSHHSHSGQFCAHAKDLLSDILEHARTLGFTHFHLSEHCPRALPEHLYPEEVEAGLDPVALEGRFVAYLAHARSLQDVLRDDLHVLVGCETENLRTHGEEGNASIDFLVQTLEKLSVRQGKQMELPPPAAVGRDVVDYLVGSVHHVRGIPIDFDSVTFERAIQSFASSSDSLSERQRNHQAHARLILGYLDCQLELLQRLRPEVVGHFDLFRLYTPDFPVRPDPAEERPHLDGLLEQVWASIERNVRYACAYGALFEVNSASLRKGWSTPYPGREILDLILQLKGRLCLSDDSHGISYVALNYPRLRDYLLAAGVEDIWYLEADDHSGSDPVQSEQDVMHRANTAQDFGDAPKRFARGTIAKRLTASEWQDHVFWSRATNT